MLEIKTTEKGAELISIKWNGIEKLHDGKTFWNRHAPILFPIVGKLKEDKTNILGKEYSMPQHGFARDSVFKKIEENVYELESNEQTKKQFPYSFVLTVSYEIEKNTLITRCKVKNIGNNTMYFGLGFHPAFLCDYSSGDYTLTFKEEEMAGTLQLKNGLIKVQEGKREGLRKICLQPYTFDNDAIILKNLKNQNVFLKNKQKVELKLDFTGFPYLGIWSKKEAPFVCIEPWMTIADKETSNGNWMEKENLISLETQKEWECFYTVTFYE